MKFTLLGRYTSTFRRFLPKQGRVRYIRLLQQWQQLDGRINTHFTEGPVKAGERLSEAGLTELLAKEYEIRVALEEMELRGY